MCVAPFAESLLKEIFPHTEHERDRLRFVGKKIVNEVEVLTMIRDE